ncbi:hemerythrin domain-containing protein [Actinopolymorpha pittospori]|uniref:Hemerythrin superfamily protein n=1 Tax=Actinopolymorpha pittospori TaxID=648752 RepID=A0A927RA71_9ACTN|nr:hemerythrin domain-containing protein [Actinopolymorpha pittospori]MBE1604725.1 hemerythrin superfamily protein [Actinopolymorpha pittospori]
MAASKDQGVVELLVEQHEQIRTLIAQVRSETGDLRRERFEDLVRLLAVLETAEEEVVHPRARREIANGERVVEARLNEESQAEPRCGRFDPTNGACGRSRRRRARTMRLGAIAYLG